MDAPIAKGTVGEIEILAEATGMDTGVESSLRSRAEPEVPVHALGRFAIGRLGTGSAGGVGERPDHADFSDLAGLEKRHARDGMGRDAAVEADLNQAARVAGGADHGLAFVNGMGDGLFDVDMGTGPDGIDRRQGVPVVGSSDDADVRPFLRQHVAVVAVAAGLVRGQLGDLGGRFIHLIGVGVGEGNGGAIAGGKGLAKDVHTPPAGADQSGFELTPGLGRE